MAQLVAASCRSRFALEHQGFFAGWPRILRPDYVRSMLCLRVAVGVAGVLLPIALWLIDWLYFDGNPEPRDSMSAYYMTASRCFGSFGSGRHGKAEPDHNRLRIHVICPDQRRHWRDVDAGPVACQAPQAAG